MSQPTARLLTVSVMVVAGFARPLATGARCDGEMRDMREINPDSFTVYSLDELEPDARRKAIEGIAELLGGDWWDSSDIDDISDVIRYTLANKFGTPDHGKYGVGDFPGIDGVTLESWDLDRGSYVGLRGTLTRENAPALPWDDDIDSVSLTAGRDYTSISVEFIDDAELTSDDAQIVSDAMEQAVRDAMHEALRDGRAEMEYKTGEEWAEQVASDREFHADGTLYA